MGPETPREPVPPERFELGAILGRGAVGVVHRAWDRVLQREVALKLLLVDRPTPVQMERFRREGELARAIDHPGGGRRLAAGTCQGRPALAFELVERARTLRQALEEGLPRRRVIELLRDAARALGAAHAAAIVHRDVKLDNLLLDGQGRLRVTDFGVATASHLARLTRSGAFVGTPRALAPEQLQGGGVHISPATDVWAMGVALHEALLGEAPFQGEDMLQLLQQIVEAPLQLRERELDPGLAAIVRRCLEKDPARRYAHGDALADALDAWLAGGEATREGGRGRRSTRPNATLVSLALLLVGVGGALLVVQRTRAGRQAEACAALASGVWAALGSGSSVAAAASRAPAWEREAERLLAHGGAPELERARHGLRLVRALAALRAGEMAPARAEVEAASGAARLALEGALAALEPMGDPEAAWEQLSRAIEGGCAADELRLWRARAALRLVEPGPERLGRALTDLADLAPGLDAGGELLRAELALRAGDLELAQACLARVGEPPPELGWRLVLAESWRGDPLLADPERLAARLERLGEAARPDAPAVRLLFQEVAARFEHEVRALVRVGQERPLTVEQRARLVALGRVVQLLGGELGVAHQLVLWEPPAEAEGPPLLLHARLLARARALCGPEVVEDLWGPCLDSLAHRALACGGDETLERLVELAPEPWLQARLRFFRGVARRCQRRWAEALEDLRAAEAWLEDPRLRQLWEPASFPGAARVELDYNLALVHEGRGEVQLAARAALACLKRSRLSLHLAGGVEVFSAEGALDLVWRLTWPGYPALARQAIEARLAEGAGRAVTWVRLARLDLLAGDREGARLRLRPVQELAKGNDEALAGLAAAEVSLDAGEADADTWLKALEDVLVRAR